MACCVGAKPPILTVAAFARLQIFYLNNDPVRAWRSRRFPEFQPLEGRCRASLEMASIQKKQMQDGPRQALRWCRFPETVRLKERFITSKVLACAREICACRISDGGIKTRYAPIALCLCHPCDIGDRSSILQPKGSATILDDAAMT